MVVCISLWLSPCYPCEVNKQKMNSNSLFIKSIKISSELINYQTVRWRKPFWLGIAKSKMFVVRQPKELPPDQKNAYNEIQNLYRTALNSLMNFIQNENPKLKDEYFSATSDNKGYVRLSPALEKAIAQSYELNKSWNAESSRRREKRKKEELEKYTEEALKLVEEKTESKKRDMEIIEEIVRKEKLLSQNFITPENLDEAVEKCLNSVEAYDFAIDLDGNRYPGTESLQDRLKESEKEMEQSAVEM